MKIGFDARLYGISGIGRYVKNLILELEKIDNTNDYIIFVTKEISDVYKPQNPRFKKWLVNAPVYSIEEQTTLWKEFMSARLGLLHVPHFNVPYFYKRKFIATIHDFTMLGLNFDATSKNQMEYLIKHTGQNLIIKKAIKKSAGVLVPSEVVKKDVLENYGVSESKIRVTLEGVDDSITKHIPTDGGVMRLKLERYKIKNKYFLYVGNAYPHKNLNNLIVAHKENLQNAKTTSQLIIAGKVDAFSQRLAAFVNGLKLSDKIIFAARYTDNGFVDDTELATLYKGALAYVFPSLNEGFSITPLEAQAVGTPVLLSDIPVHKEVFGDSVLYFKADSNIDLSTKLLEIENNDQLRNELIQKGYENIKKYSWAKMAQETLDFYNSFV